MRQRSRPRNSSRNPKSEIRNPKLPLGVLFTLALFASAAHAQETAATLVGQVVDPTGGRIASVEITVVNGAGIEKSVMTDSQGNFAVSGLTPGRYTIRASAPGFAVYEDKSVDFAAGARRPFTLIMRIAIQ